MRPVYLVGDPVLSEWDAARLLMAARFPGAPLVIVDGRFYEAPNMAAPAAEHVLRSSTKAASAATRAAKAKRARAFARHARKATRRSVSA